MINQDEIDTIKRGVELVPFMKACGIELQQVGGNYRGLCPFHEDTSPSLRDCHKITLSQHDAMAVSYSSIHHEMRLEQC